MRCSARNVLASREALPPMVPLRHTAAV
ncbi:hypothetical protein GA0115261_104041, partial [Streptomyces sp. OspMP-M43]